MENKFLNFIGIMAVLIAVTVAVFTWKEKRMNDTLGQFNLNAIENIDTRLAAAIANARAQTEQLANMPGKTYMNFVRPLMDIDAAIDKITGPVSHLDSVNNSPETQRAVDTMLPMLAEYGSDMARHRGVYEGFLEVRKNEYDKLAPAQKRIVDDAIKAFEIAGVNLPAQTQARLKEIEAKMAPLSNKFSNNIIAANKKYKIKITDEKLLGDMPGSDRAAARVDDGWEFSLLAPSYIPFMEYVTDAKLRADMYRQYLTRAPENGPIIAQILQLRAEHARILGFDNFAELQMQFRDAKNPATATDFLWELVRMARPVGEKEYKELVEFAGGTLAPSDLAYYSRIMQKQRYDLDEAETKPYFELNRTTDDVLKIVADMFDIQFRDGPADKWHETVRYYDVIKDSKVIGGIFLDLQTRESKQSGAWQDGLETRYRDANGALHRPVAVVVANFPPARDGAPSLMSLNDVSTLFHELGHAMHHLLTDVDERDAAGTNVAWDTVEFPSQFLESFWRNPAVLRKIGRHYQTGEVISEDLIAKINNAAKFQKGLFLLRQLELGLFDLNIHQNGTQTEQDVQKTMDDVRARVSVIKVAPYNKFQHTFGHIFGGGYAAGYYSYLWAEKFAADAYMAFRDDPFNKELARRYRDTVLAMGDTKDMSQIYIDFMGRPANTESLLKYYGLK